MATEAQVKANRINSKQSTGPRSDQGKKVVSANRITHGILSTKLLLEGESADDYQSVLDGLIADLQPLGLLEMAMVEKVLVLIWRQRRLIAAETSTIKLSTNKKKVLSEVCGGLGVPDYGSQALTESDMNPPNPEQQAWCRDVIAEYSSTDDLALDNLKDRCPLIYAQLVGDAEGISAVQHYLDEYCDRGLDGYVRELVRWCRRQIKNGERYPLIVQLTEQAQQKLRVPWGRLELLSKYQVSLDNQLYKALKALREAQEWRLNTQVLEGGSTPENESNVQVA